MCFIDRRKFEHCVRVQNMFTSYAYTTYYTYITYNVNCHDETIFAY
jgi:hypothetical protein